MNDAVCLLLAINVDLPRNTRGLGRGSTMVLSDGLLIVGLGLAVLVLLACAVYVWNKLLRKRRRHVSSGEKVFRHSHRGSDDHDSADLEEDDEDEEEEEEEEVEDDPDSDEEDHHQHKGHHHDKRRYKYRVRRRTHRTRNPTLSQTGGLPPVKAQEPTKPG